MGKKHSKTGQLFNVDILIENDTNAGALEQLLHIMNEAGFKDFRINSGIELGRIIELSLQENVDSVIPQEPADSSHDTTDNANQHIIELIQFFKDNQTLIRLSVLKGKGIKLSLPCKVLGYDDSTQNLSVYHVDEKKVYLFKLNEIDDIGVS